MEMKTKVFELKLGGKRSPKMQEGGESRMRQGRKGCEDFLLHTAGHAHAGTMGLGDPARTAVRDSWGGTSRCDLAGPPLWTRHGALL